jgi:3-oxoacyl-[acyl-carrier protein] reductase
MIRRKNYTGSDNTPNGKTDGQIEASDGCITIQYVRNVAEATAVVRSIEADGGTAVAIQADISDIDETKRLFQQTIARFCELDTLVANAGYCTFSPLAEMSEAEFDRI